jgi:hypothetical protein
MGEWKSLKTADGTGWKSIDRVAGTGWKSLDWDSVPIDVGGACIDRPSYRIMSAYTWIDKNNPANANGTITNVCVYANAVTANDWYAGIFYLVSGTTYKCRSAANIGVQSGGSNNNAVSLAIQAGDLIGVYASSSDRLEQTLSGNEQMYKPGNTCVADNEGEYSALADRELSLYGTG